MGLLGKGRYSAGLNRVALSFRNRNESRVRRRASAAPQATRGKPSIIIIYEYLYRIKHFNESSLLSTCVLLKIINQTEAYEISYLQFFDKMKGYKYLQLFFELIKVCDLTKMVFEAILICSSIRNLSDFQEAVHCISLLLYNKKISEHIQF